MIDKFINDNINIFVVFGFFMALAGYFSNSLKTLENGFGFILNLGVVSSLAISILLCAVIFKNLYNYPSENYTTIQISDFSLENLERFLFAIPFLLIILTLFMYIFKTYNAETYLILILLAYIISIPLYVKLYEMIFSYSHPYTVPILIMVVSAILYNLLDNYNSLIILIIQAILSTFASMSLLIVSVTFIQDIKSMVDRLKEHISR
ncbi:hypothetical protein [Methanohalophilus sp. WG1-DM]|uniref:hypothetical protein n=1 Tax=Methanohalophilus sp. WG1-DM TaxID=2491675 RepID=UPI000FFF46DE|nr:hypothetical protein [Methanohalophilus sp. WG1-DM]RXG35172.1 hypothetical protein CI957_196 [Methanohalophilus sp. WG1-DM]